MDLIRNYLSQRYPYEENKWKLIIPISLFIGLFMVIFQPFGLNDVGTQLKFLMLAGYGLVTFIILISNLVLIPALFPNTFREEKWTIGKELFFLLWILFTVGLGNLLYSTWVMDFLLTLNNMLIFQAYTLVVGIIPITALTLIKQNYLKHKNEERAKIISSSLAGLTQNEPTAEKVKFGSDTGKEQVSLLVSDLLFIKSDGNYITVGYLRNGKMTKTMLRNTMKYAADLMEPYPFILQCHRSWLVNLGRIKKVSGNSQGLRLLVEGFDEEIPVARNQSASFRKKITREPA